jgi:tetraprenyl-beta-curcumene synthase
MRQARDLGVLALMMGRFAVRVVPLARAQLRHWERAAQRIPDARLREHALSTLRGESFSALGAALVAVTARRHDRALVRLLVALQVAWDYIDTVSEQPASDPIANGTQLHRALLDAVSIGPPSADYYRCSDAHEDGGYLAALVARCREAAARLPAFELVRPSVAEALRTAEVQYCNHAPAAERAPALRRWAARERGSARIGWIEAAAAASSSLGVLAVLALAADPRTTASGVARVRAAYVPWADALTALLDSLVDHEDDRMRGVMNWVACFPSRAVATARLQSVTAHAVGAMRQLPRGERHLAIVVGMIAMHLSRGSAWVTETAPTSRAVLRATGTAMAPLLLLLLRGWRGVRRTEVFSSE